MYAGQGSGSVSAATPAETAALAGGGDNSYGYGSTARRDRPGAVIDLRRAGAVRVTPVVFQEAAAEEDDVAEVASPAPATAPAAAEPAPATEEGAQPWLERERVGPPYQANGQWYVPTPEPGYAQTGTASWYGSQFHGQRTASGEVFDQQALTAAHPTLPIPSLVQVTNLENGREVIVRVNDRGPFVGERVIDLSRGAAQALDFEGAGHARVHVRYLGPAPRRVNADGSQAPASPPSPPSAVPAQADQEEGPRSLLPPSSGTDLAGAPVDNPPYAAPQPAYSAPVSGGYFVQVGAFSDLSNAHRVRDTIGAAGPVVVDVRQTASGAELFRVRVGPYVSREEADAARRTLSSMGYGETIVASR
ncbi:Rare lipoprotein A precursor [Terricaulis silvestris]|uniref:Endolytic peptidoglycan transglycosylase RlpA n=1 Tax=Terricaulis silvestris TaxID=2686094 RepID=A0A6I6MKC5_9CAUL|nr:Rare lipoprotein A precursor [Terricaulis silvestris]